MQISANQPIDFDQLKAIMLKGEKPNVPSSAYDYIIDLFEKRAFRENPYQFLVEHLLDHYIPHLAIINFNEYRLSKNLPNFEHIVSLNLLEDIAKKRFKEKPEYEKIMPVFYESLYSVAFSMRFESCKRHLNIDELAIVIKHLFYSALQLKTYPESEDFLRAYDDICE